MIPYSLADLRTILSAELYGDENEYIQHINFDSRLIMQPVHSLFIALKGPQKDGHEFIKDAYEKGIRNFMVEVVPQGFSDANFLKVEDTRKAFQLWAKYHVQQTKVPIIGITGSNGKTIVKEWLYQLLLHDYRVVRSPKSFNSQIGVPLSVLEIQKSDELAIIELGISQPGEMELIAEIAQPKIGVLTNVGTAHTAFFEDREQHITEKIRLFKHADTIIYPYDDIEVRKLISEHYGDKKLIGFGLSQETTVTLLDSNDEMERISYQDENYTIAIPSKDEASVQDALICFSVLTQLKVDLNQISHAFKKLSPVEMRLEIKEGAYNSVIINDTFNSDLTSIRIALNVLNQQKKIHKTLILTDILQNRMQGEDLYGKLAEWVNAYPIEKVYLIGDEITQYKDKFHALQGTYGSTQDFIDFIKPVDFRDEAVLLKGARIFGLESISKKLEKKSHDTILEVNLQSLLENVNHFRSKLKPDTKMMCMVKAFGYGTGGFEVAQALASLNVDYLGVAYADEGAELRERGITTPIMVMNPEQSSYDTIIKENLEAEIYSFRVLEKFTLKLIENQISQAFPIHIKLNTGMNRLGFKENEISELVQQLADNPYVKVISIFSHLATSDMPEESTFVHEQVNRFKKMYDKLSFNLGYEPMRHILNSAGISNYSEYQMEMVRLGIGMYGVAFNPQEEKYLKHVVEFKTVISQITQIEPGETVSYGRHYTAEKVTRIATLPVGYADGVKRCLGNEKGHVAIHGALVPILGTVCMDMIMVDVTNIECEEGDEVVIFGEKPTLFDIAKDADTITYEILTSVSSRVKRVYLQ